MGGGEGGGGSKVVRTVVSRLTHYDVDETKNL